VALRPRWSRAKLLLLDEPMSALDAQIRKRLREELKRLQKELRFTGLFVTHDREAL
jgi:putative spermidine/putrescine transport system ATP-binding protein